MNTRDMAGWSLTELAQWSIANGWAPAETVVERDRAVGLALMIKSLMKEGVNMDQTQWWKPQTTGAGVSQGCHLCGAKTVKRTTVEKLGKKKVEGEKRWVWRTVVTKVFECGTVASQDDDARGRTKVKVGKECIDISELTKPEPEEEAS